MKQFNITMKVNGKSVVRQEPYRNSPELKNKQHIFIIGSKGIPAAYGGFETFVEKLTEYKISHNIQYHVARMAADYYCYEYNDARCFDIKVPNIGPGKAVFYDIAALRASIKYCKKMTAVQKPVFYILACRIGPFIWYYKKKIRKLGGTLMVNPDGHEWKRAKWSAPVRKYWKISEKWMVKHADLLICDSKHIEACIQKDYPAYRPNTTFIAYGSDVMESLMSDHDPEFTGWFTKHDLSAKKYYLIVGRFVPENNFEIMIREFMKSKSDRDLVIITTVNPKFMNQLEERLKFSRDKRIKFVGTVYNQNLLKKIRENAYGYLHGHEVGGTNPSLLEALSSTKLNLLLDVEFNKEVAEETALYWSKKNGDLCRLIAQADSLSQDNIEAAGRLAKERIMNFYSWKSIVGAYEKVFFNVVHK